MAMRACQLVLLFFTLTLVLYTSYSKEGFDSYSTDFSDQFVSSEKGNDILIYTPSHGKQKSHYYMAGAGLNTLWLRLTDEEIQNPIINADIIRFYYFLLNNVVSFSATSSTTHFTFAAFRLTLQNFENIIIERIPSPDNFIQQDETPTIPTLPMLRDSSVDTLS